MKNEADVYEKYWDHHRGYIRTRKGGGIIGEVVTSHGYTLLEDLLGNASYFQVLILNITGKLPDRRLAEWLEGIFICMSWPDARIWCNQIGSLGGTLRASPLAAISAGILASDSRYYGPGTLEEAAVFITNALNKKCDGHTIEQIVNDHNTIAGKFSLPGFFRPYLKGDERVDVMQKLADKLGFKIADHLALSYEIQQYVYEKYGEGMNLAGYVASFLSDMGFTAKEIVRMCSMVVMAGVHACYAEAADREPESFLPLRCDDIEYTGVPERPVPKGLTE